VLLADKYRPRTFAEVVGQPLAVSALTSAIENGSGAALLLIGPSGTGKTTAARIYGASLLCEKKSDQPCGKCGTCTSVLEGRFCYGYYEQDGGRFTKAEHTAVLSDLLNSSPFGKLVVFLDEVHAIDTPAANALLKAVENPSSPAVFIGATTEELSVLPALRKRCRIVRFKPLTGVQTFEMLASVCQREGIGYRPRALDMIAAASDGSMRDALLRLEQVAEQGEVTEGLVAQTLCLGTTDDLVQYLVAVTEGDLAAQEAALIAWQAEPEEKHRQIRDCLLFIYNRQVASAKLDHIIDPSFHQISERDQLRIKEGFKARAGGRDLGEFFFDLFGFWEINPQVLTDRASLLARMMRFHRAVNSGPGGNGSQSPGPSPVALAPMKREYRARSARRPGVPGQGAQDHVYLSSVQVERLYDAATFLPQEHGLLFNTLVHLDHGALGIVDENLATELVSKLTHELSLRCKVWSHGAKAHWLYVHRNTGCGIQTDIVLHLPPEALDRVAVWLNARMEQWFEEGAHGWVLDAANSARANGWQKNRVQRHWALVRKLWGGLDPDVEEWGRGRRRVPLLDLLGVRSEDRKPVGGVRRAIGSSRSLAPSRRQSAAERRMALLSALKDDAWEALFSGWELDEFRDREAERVRRQEARERVELEYPMSSNPLEARARETALASLEASWPIDPKSRLRSWKGWWA
jgi:DNA polymerase III subunit gamma/tau